MARAKVRTRLWPGLRSGVRLWPGLKLGLGYGQG